MKKTIAVLGMAKLPVAQKIERARYIVTSVTGNPMLTGVAASLTTITANINSLETTSITAKSGGKDETAVMRMKAKALDLSMKTLCDAIEGIANLNPLTAESVILSAGLNLRKESAPRPNGFRISHGKNPGEIEVKTDAEHRTLYRFEMTLTPEEATSWKEINAGTRARFLATGLESGKRHYFRSAKTGKNGTGPWSNVLDAIAL